MSYLYTSKKKKKKKKKKEEEEIGILNTRRDGSKRVVTRIGSVDTVVHLMRGHNVVLGIPRYPCWDIVCCRCPSTNNRYSSTSHTSPLSPPHLSVAPAHLLLFVSFLSLSVTRTFVKDMGGSGNDPCGHASRRHMKKTA